MVKRTCVNRSTCISIFSRSVKTVHTNLFAKICYLQLEFRKTTPFGHALYPLTDIQADFEINRPVRYRYTAKGNYFHTRQTDGQTSRTTTIGIFIEKIIKNIMYFNLEYGPCLCK